MISFSEFRFAAEHYAVLFAFLLAAYVIGGSLLKAQTPPEHAGRLFVYTTFGLGVLIVFLFFISLAGLLYRTMVVFGIASWIGYFLYKRDFTIFRMHDAFSRKTLYRVLFLLLLLSPVFMVPLYPPTKWDEISYHLPYARFYVQNHGLEYNPFLRYPLYAHNYNLLYSLALLFSDDIVAHLFHAAAAVLTAAGIYSLGAMTSGRGAGFLAAGIFLTSPLVTYLMGTSYIDLGLTLFVYFTFYCIALWSFTKRDYWLYVAGFAAGIAAGCKYSGLFYASLFVLWVVLEGRSAKTALKFTLPLLVFGSAWYIRNIAIAGDPLSPLGGKWFGYWMWNEQDLIGQSKDLIASYGTPKNIGSFLMLPWNLVRHFDKFGDGAISPAMLAVFPAVFLFNKFDSFIKKAYLFAIINVALWFFSTQILRYLLPVFPAISLVSAAALMRGYEVGVQRFLAKAFSRWWTPSLRKLAAGIALSLVVLPSAYADSIMVRAMLAKPLPVNEAMRHQYLEKEIAPYALLRTANRQPALPLYQLGFENGHYFADGRMMGDWFGPARYAEVLDVVRQPRELHGKLKAKDAQLFLVNERRFNLQFDDSFSEYFELIKEDGQGKLFLVKDVAVNDAKRAAFANDTGGDDEAIRGIVLWDLVQIIDRSKLAGDMPLNAPWNRTIAVIKIEEENNKTAIFSHPDSSLEFRMKLPRGKKMRFTCSTGFYPASRNWGSDGVRLSVQLETKAQSYILMNDYIMPQQGFTSRSISLDQFAGEDVALKLSSVNDPGKHANGDWSVWIEPRILEIER